MEAFVVSLVFTKQDPTTSSTVVNVQNSVGIYIANSEAEALGMSIEKMMKYWPDYSLNTKVVFPVLEDKKAD